MTDEAFAYPALGCLASTKRAPLVDCSAGMPDAPSSARGTEQTEMPGSGRAARRVHRPKKKPGELEIDRFTARQKSLLTTDKQVSDEGN